MMEANQIITTMQSGGVSFSAFFSASRGVEIVGRKLGERAVHAGVLAHGAGRFILIGIIFRVEERGIASDDCSLLLRCRGPVVGRY